MTSCTRTFAIDGRAIGHNCPPYIIAEMSGNHNGDIDRALRILHAAKKAGAHAVKMQTYTADTLTINHAGDDFLIKGGLWDGRTLYDLYNEAHTPWEWHQRLFKEAKDLNITLFSTPFDESSVDFLEELKVPLYKIASFELLDLPLLKKVAQTNKPIILSTGMATMEDIEVALNVIRQITDQPVVLLHCISAYPAPLEESNLHAIKSLSEKFKVISGLSDHTIGNAAAIAATALGAKVIEKHFTLSRKDKGPDSAFSMEPTELEDLVQSCYSIFQACTTATTKRAPSEQQSLTFRRSIYIIEDIPKGARFNNTNIRIIRPGFGLSPVHYEKVLRSNASRDLKRGDALQWDMIS